MMVGMDSARTDDKKTDKEKSDTKKKSKDQVKSNSDGYEYVFQDGFK